MGGPIQPQVQLQIVLAILKYGLTIQEAIDLPRCNFVSGNSVQFEPGIPGLTLTQLEAMGHNILPHTGANFGSAHAIQVDSETGTYFGACDPRTDGAALGY
jgi:gamma-glutamyltranspeptidase/glutathione hydrolase